MIGSVVAGHRIVRLVGRGGMGVVYEAIDEALGRSVALKLVAPERADQPGFRERFIAESRLAASIDHPNVLPVFKAGEDEGLLYLAMRLVDGADLRTLAPLEPARAAHVVAQVGAALDAAHARRLVHRDVKPANVLVGAADHAYLTDFGLVKALDETSGHTRTGDVVGTLDYIAPERIRGEGDGPAGRRLRARLRALLRAHRRGPVPARRRRAQAVGAPSTRRRRCRATPPSTPSSPARWPRTRRSATAAARSSAPRRWRPPAARSRARCSRPPAAPSAASAPRATRRSPPRPPRSLAALEHAGERARLLREALAETPPERIEQRLAEVRAGRDPGKAKLVAALAQHLAVQRRMQAALAAFDAETERILLELETVRGRVAGRGCDRRRAPGLAPGRARDARRADVGCAGGEHTP